MSQPWNHGTMTTSGVRELRREELQEPERRRLGAMSHQVARLHGLRPSGETTTERVDGATSSASRSRARAEETSR